MEFDLNLSCLGLRSIRQETVLHPAQKTSWTSCVSTGGYPGGVSWKTTQLHNSTCSVVIKKSAATVNCLTVNHVFFSVGGDGNLTTVTTLPSESPSSQRHLHHSHISPSKLSILFIPSPPPPQTSLNISTPTWRASLWEWANKTLKMLFSTRP